MGDWLPAKKQRVPTRGTPTDDPPIYLSTLTPIHLSLTDDPGPDGAGRLLLGKERQIGLPAVSVEQNHPIGVNPETAVWRRDVVDGDKIEILFLQLVPAVRQEIIAFRRKADEQRRG